MDVYSEFKAGMIIRTQAEDVLTLEPIRYDAKTHPSSVITVRRANSIPYPLSTTSVVDILEKGNGTDPITRIPFHPMVKERAYLYKKALERFPGYRNESLNTTELYKKWISTFLPDCKLAEKEKEEIRLQARCFLQAEDLVGMFKNFAGQGSLSNREQAEKYLTENKQPWILRTCSLATSQYCSAYCLSRRTPSGAFMHVAILNRIGEGFYFSIRADRGSRVFDQQMFSGKEGVDYKRGYVTIIDLLEKEVMTAANTVVVNSKYLLYEKVV